MKNPQLTAKVRDVLAKHDLVGFPSAREDFAKKVYPLTFFNLLIFFPTFFLRTFVYSLLTLAALYLLVFSEHSYLIKMACLALILLALHLIHRSYSFYHHFGGLTKAKGLWAKSTVLINPNLPELKLVEIIAHEFYHFLEMRGLVRPGQETLATAVGLGAAGSAGADPYDDPEQLFGMWIAATSKNPNAGMERIMNGPGMTREEFPQFKKWLSGGKLVGNRAITEQQRKRACNYFEKRLAREEEQRSHKPAGKTNAEARKERFAKLIEEGVALGAEGKHAAAWERFAEAHQIARALDDADMELLSLNLLAVATRRLGRTAEALQLLRQALGLAQEKDKFEARRATMQTLAETHKEVGQLEEAFRVLYDLASVEKAEGNMAEFARTLSQMGHVLMGLGQTERALGYFHKAGQLSRELGLLDEELKE